MSNLWYSFKRNRIFLCNSKYESMESDFQPLTPENLELMAELDKLCK